MLQWESGRKADPHQMPEHKLRNSCSPDAQTHNYETLYNAKYSSIAVSINALLNTTEWET